MYHLPGVQGQSDGFVTNLVYHYCSVILRGRTREVLKRFDGLGDHENGTTGYGRLRER